MFGGYLLSCHADASQSRITLTGKLAEMIQAISKANQILGSQRGSQRR